MGGVLGMVMRWPRAIAADWRAAYGRACAPRFGEEDARALRAERVGMVAANTVATVTCNIVYVLVLCLIFLGRGADVPLLVWTAGMVALSSLVLARSLRRKRARRPSGSKRSVWMVVRNSALMSFGFSVVPFFLIPVTHGAETAVLGGVTAVAMVIGPYTLYTVPQAALAWIAVAAVLNTLSFGLTDEPAYHLVALCSVVIALGMARACLAQAGRLTDRFADRLALSEQARTLQEPARSRRRGT